MNNNNFLAQGHHLQSLATEGGGFWDFSPSDKKSVSGNPTVMNNFLKYNAPIEDSRSYLSHKNNFCYPPLAALPPLPPPLPPPPPTTISGAPSTYVSKENSVNAISTQTSFDSVADNTIRKGGGETVRSSSRAFNVSNFGQQTDSPHWNESSSDSSRSSTRMVDEGVWYNRKANVLEDKSKNTPAELQPRTPFGQPSNRICVKQEAFPFASRTCEGVDELRMSEECGRNWHSKTTPVDRLRDGYGISERRQLMHESLVDDDESLSAESKTIIKMEPIGDGETRKITELGFAKEVQENIER